MKLSKYFRQLKFFLVLPKQFRFKKIYYSYYRKIFFKFLLYGLFKDEIQIKFGSDYWRHVPKYIFSMITYYEDLINYKLNMCYYNKIKKKTVQFLPPFKPLHPILRATRIYVDELILEDVAYHMGFEVADEKLTSLKSVYTLTLSSN